MRLPTDRILRAVCAGLTVERAALLRRRRDSQARAVASRMLCDFGGLTQRQVADVLGLRSGAAVSAQLRKLTEHLKTDARLRRQLADIAAELKNSQC